LLLFSLDLT